MRRSSERQVKSRWKSASVDTARGPVKIGLVLCCICLADARPVRELGISRERSPLAEAPPAGRRPDGGVARGAPWRADRPYRREVDLQGRYDSTLVSPAYPVTLGTTRTLRYVTHYLQEGGRTADVLVSFNDGANQLVKRYTADARAKPRR